MKGFPSVWPAQVSARGQLLHWPRLRARGEASLSHPRFTHAHAEAPLSLTQKQPVSPTLRQLDVSGRPEPGDFRVLVAGPAPHSGGDHAGPAPALPRQRQRTCGNSAAHGSPASAGFTRVGNADPVPPAPRTRQCPKGTESAGPGQTTTRGPAKPSPAASSASRGSAAKGDAGHQFQSSPAPRTPTAERAAATVRKSRPTAPYFRCSLAPRASRK